jgi:hypothetical protein
MKKIIIIMLLCIASTSAMAQSDIIKMVNDKQFKVIKAKATDTIISEIWLNGEYLGKTRFTNIAKRTKCNVNDWQFVKDEQLNVVITNIKLHQYWKGDRLPNTKIDDFMLNLAIASKSFSQWRIYLRGD